MITMMGFYSGLFLLMIVLAVLFFVYCVIKLALDHAQNMKRITQGYPVLDGIQSGDCPHPGERLQ